jgi:predicted transcriptional regulator
MGKKPFSAEAETFRALIKLVRIEAELSQVELSTQLGRPQSYVSDYENGQRRLDWIQIVEIVTICGTTIVEFAKRYQAQARMAQK